MKSTSIHLFVLTISVQSLILIITFAVIWPIICLTNYHLIPSTSTPHHVIMGGGSATMAQWKTSVLPSSSWKIMIMVMMIIQMWSVQGISMMYDHRDFMEWTRKMFIFVNDCDRCKCDLRCDWWCDYRWEISLRTKLCKPRVEILFGLEHNFLWKNDSL